LDINQSALTSLGFKHFGELKGKSVSEVFGQAYVDRHLAQVRLIKKTQTPVVFEGYSPMTGKFYIFSYVPLDDKTFVHTALDITQRKRDEEELHRSRELLRNIIDNSDSIIMARDLDGKLILLNRTLAKRYKMPKEKVLGTTLYDVHPKAVADEIATADRKVITEGKALSYEETVPLNGERHTYLSNKFPLYDSKGQIYGVGGVITDITERKNLQKKLEDHAKHLEKLVRERTESIRKSEQNYRELYESFGEAFIATDWELTVIHWNTAAERVTLIPAKEALGKKIYEVLPEMNTVDITPFYEMLQSKKTIRFMMNVKSRQSGQDAIFEISSYASQLGIIVIVEDKTEEEQTKRLSTIGQVAGMVGHDIRNPLQAITSELYLAKQAIAGVASRGTDLNGVSESIHAIQEQVDYINKIVSDLQDFAKQFTPEYREVELDSLVMSTLATIRIPDNIKFTVDVEGSAKFTTDPTFIRRALTNLANNAIQAMPNGGKLIIKGTKKDEKILLTVEDTGKGIPEDVKQKMFTPLFTTKSKGQGFGLAATKRLIDALNGKITFESQEGKGTRFVIELPLAG
jgi:PAS domain S-box-containing protein